MIDLRYWLFELFFSSSLFIYLFIPQDESETVTISGYRDVPENNEQSLLKALVNQPLSVAIDASGRDFQFYSGVSQLIN